MNKSNKDKNIALILCIIFGYFGLHRFYTGKIKSGILYLFTFGLLGFGWIYDIFEIARNRFRDSKGAYLTAGAVSPKPTYKMWQFWVVVVILLIALGSTPDNKPKKEQSNVSTDTDSIRSANDDSNTDTSTDSESKSEVKSEIKSDVISEVESKEESEAKSEIASKEETTSSEIVSEEASFASSEEEVVQSTASHEKYEVSAVPTIHEYVFIINTENNKVHKSTCHKGQEVLPEHRFELTVQEPSEAEAIQYVIDRGYDPCGICMK